MGIRECMRRPSAALLVLALCLLVSPPAAMAAPPEFLDRVTAGDGQAGEGAAEVSNPRAVGANPTSGRIYVGDLGNARIDEYTAWGLFVKSWGWGVADGSAELQVCGPVEPEESPDPSLCREGLPGAGKGQISPLGGVAVDGAGNVWVGDLERRRIQKFTPAGEFLLMLGGDVNKTKVEEGAPAAQRNVCPIAPTDVCQAGAAGTAPSQLPFTVRNVVAYSPVGGGAILVGDEDEIQVFNLDGTYRESIPFSGALAAFAGKAVNALGVDSAGNVYLSLEGVEDLYKIDPTGTPLAPGKPGESKFEVEVPLGVAVDHVGNVYAIEGQPTPAIVPEVAIVRFDSAGNKTLPTQAEEEANEFFPFVPFQGPRLNGIATNICAGSPEPGSLYVAAFRSGSASFVDAYGGPPIGCEAPPLRAPVISEQYAAGVGSESAQLQAQINPRFWSDATYYVEYGESPCSTGGCTSQVPIDPALLTAQSINKALKTALVNLGDLEPGVTYHYRFVAQSGGGGPVYGIDPDGEGPEEPTYELGLEGSFRTLNRPTPQPACPNDSLRKGPGARLPDCRAYEMVSPLDKEGGDVALWIGKNALFPLYFERDQSALSGNRFTYSSAYGFGDAESAPYVSQYLADRTAAGWRSDAISPPRSEIPIPLDNFGPGFQLFSTDLCQAWLLNNSVAPLAPGAVPGFPNLYRRENCAEPPTYEALTTVEPPNREASKYVRLVARGASDDGSHAIFTANDKLHEDAPVLPDEFEQLLYEATPAGLRFVCYLTDGSPSPDACGAGTPGANDHNAISSDGSHIFWTPYTGGLGGSSKPGAPGPIHVRIEGTETSEVSGSVAPDPAWYWTAAEDGSTAIFHFASGTHAGELYEFDVATETQTLIAKGVEGPMGASEDASRLYFASTEDLDDTGPGSNGAHNLYLYDASAGEDDFTFVMTLAARDVGGSSGVPSPIDEAPEQRSAVVTPDGLHATFTAVAPPPFAYDNREVTSDKPATEVYRYDAAENELMCLSCNPTGARPVAEEIETGSWAAARIQGWEFSGHAPRVISDDGSRVFFESFEALVPRDTNGAWDVYQWEEPGKGTCDEGDPTFGTEAGGCVDLISSGESPAKSTFLDADPSGDNVFFSTQSSLVGQDYGLNDVYVARVGGGFPEPQPNPICEGDACQGPSAAPVPPTPSSSTYRGPEAVKAKRCPKGKRAVKRAGRVRCAKKRRHKGTGSQQKPRRKASR